MVLSIPPRRAGVTVTAVVVTLTLLLVAAAGCSSGFSGNELRAGVPQAPVPASEAREAAGPVSALGSRLLGELVSTTDGNIAFSPSVLATQLAMIRLGAATATAAEIDALLGLVDNEASDRFLASIPAVTPLLETRLGPRRSSDRRGRVVVAEAVALWIQRGTEIDDTYLEALAGTLGTGIRQVDFRSGAEVARQAVNRWASEATDNRVEQMAPRGRITTGTQLLSTGALWLSAPWLHPFNVAATSEAPFTTDTGRVVDVAMMELPASSGVSWARGPTWQAVELPYLGRELSMVAIIADPGAEDDLEQALTSGLIDEVTSALVRTQALVRMPRFAFTTQAVLSPPLTSLGAVTLFDRDLADLTRLAPTERLALSEVIQEVFLSVDEEGSTARVATSTRPADQQRIPDVEVTFDRPFLVWIVDRSSRLPLIAARVGDPTQ